MQGRTFRTIGITFAMLGLVLFLTRSAAGIPFLVIGATFVFIWWDQDKKRKKGKKGRAPED